MTIALALILLAGCATPINWQARVGVYTYDQALKDHGPPPKYTKLSDGTTVAEWMTERGETVVTPGPDYYYGPVYGPGPYARGYVAPVGPAYTTSYYPAQYIRLTFGPDGRLRAWKKFSE
jgi:hypothetical protein